MGRPSAPLLSVEIIVKAAMELVANEGNLSLRKVAEKLGVSTPSLYNHVKSKSELVNLMRDYLVSVGPNEIPASATWQDMIEIVAKNQRAAFSAYPSLLTLFVTTEISAPSVLGLYEHLVISLKNEGLSDRTIYMLIEVLRSFTLGMGLEKTTPIHMWSLDGIPPHISDVMESWEDQVSRLDIAFEFGLNMFIAGVTRLIEEAKLHPTPRASLNQP